MYESRDEDPLEVAPGVEEQGVDHELGEEAEVRGLRQGVQHLRVDGAPQPQHADGHLEPAPRVGRGEVVVPGLAALVLRPQRRPLPDLVQLVGAGDRAGVVRGQPCSHRQRVVLLVLDLGHLRERIHEVHGSLGRVCKEAGKVVDRDLAIPCGGLQAAPPLLVELRAADAPSRAARVPRAEQRRGRCRAGARHLDERPHSLLLLQVEREQPEVMRWKLAILHCKVEGGAACLVLQPHQLLAVPPAQQHAHQAGVAKLRGQVQRRLPRDVRAADARVDLDEGLHAVQAVEPDGIVDWQVVHLVVRDGRGIGVCAVLDQKPDRARVAHARCQVDRLQFSAEDVRSHPG
mmetsp:Transcript_124946/g.364940  ORF Transcript_124946/g.364940 Transcript_124946/m.364940 type:complete len:346 (-) Transcript_124946:398-1435(-)